MALPFETARQELAVTGGRSRRGVDRERKLSTYLQARIPAMRAEKERKKLLDLHKTRLDMIQEQHEEEMGLREKEILEASEARKESERIAAEGLRVHEKALEEQHEQAKYGTWLSTASVALQALSAFTNKKNEPWIVNKTPESRRYSAAMSASDEEGRGGGGVMFPVFQW